jgi:hypothetical protein
MDSQLTSLHVNTVGTYTLSPFLIERMEPFELVYDRAIAHAMLTHGKPYFNETSREQINFEFPREGLEGMRSFEETMVGMEELEDEAVRCMFVCYSLERIYYYWMSAD